MEDLSTEYRGRNLDLYNSILFIVYLLNRSFKKIAVCARDMLTTQTLKKTISSIFEYGPNMLIFP